VKLNSRDFGFVCDIVRERSAIQLDERKAYLVETRLGPLARELGFGDIQELVQSLNGRRSGTTVDRIIDAMTTNETSWMRDVHPYEALITTCLPDIAQRRPAGTIKIWSAACSTGQEPYGLAMAISERIPHLRERVKIVATDISDSALARAKSGTYTQLEVNRGLPVNMMTKYFRREGASWAVNSRIQSMVSFKKLNLIAPIVGMSDIDVVLLRNVLIYFDTAAKVSILKRVRTVVRDEAWLLLGSSEIGGDVGRVWKREHVGKTAFFRPEVGAVVGARP